MPLSIVGLNVYYWIGSLKQICTGRKIKMSETSSVLKNSQDIRKMASGSSFKAIFVVSSLFQKNDKNGKPYFEMTVTDQSGTLEAKIWSDAVWFDRSDPETDPSSIQGADTVQLQQADAAGPGEVPPFAVSPVIADSAG